MVKLDELRISKLKCLSCGSRDKRISILSFGPKNERIGFATTCCNCGHTKKYIFRDRKKNPINNKALVMMLEGRCQVSEIFCAIPKPFCDKKDCDLYNKRMSKKEITYKELMERKSVLHEFSRSGEIRNMKNIERKRFF